MLLRPPLGLPQRLRRDRVELDVVAAPPKMGPDQDGELPPLQGQGEGPALMDPSWPPRGSPPWARSRRPPERGRSLDTVPHSKT